MVVGNEYLKALYDFRRIRQKVALQHLWASITGKSLKLIPFDEISRKLHIAGSHDQGLQEIELSKIIGSVGRSDDFDRNFLPLKDGDEDRWARVKVAMTSMEGAGVPPIVVYKLDDSYFVLDGNHRVSIAREMGMKYIEAYVTEVKTRVPFSPEMDAKAMIIQAEYADFLSETQISSVLPDIRFKLTRPGQYKVLLEHIHVHQYFMGIDNGREVSLQEAILHWYETIYQPVIEVIQEQGVLEDFPERTETDFYLWILDHQSKLQAEKGWAIRTEDAAADLVKEPVTSIAKVTEKIGGLDDLHLTGADEFIIDFCKCDNIFTRILVTLNGAETGWLALQQALLLAQKEDSEVLGLYVLRKGEDEGCEKIVAMQARFTDELAQAGRKGKLTFTEGEIAEKIIDASRFNDILVMRVTYPPSTNILERLTSGLRTILRKSLKPVLIVKDNISPIDNLLLAYDGSPKSKDALYLAAYFAMRWDCPLSVMTVQNMTADKDPFEEVRTYLESRKVKAQYMLKQGEIHTAILGAAEETDAKLIIMGGYGFSPFMEALFGSELDPVLRSCAVPLLICQ